MVLFDVGDLELTTYAGDGRTVRGATDGTDEHGRTTRH